MKKVNGMASSPEIEVSPEVLKWARNTSGYSIEEAAKRTKLKQESITSWEHAAAKIRFSDIEKLAKTYKRPTAALLLDKPPGEPVMPPYFRKKSDKAEMNPELRFAIRKARYLQEVATELEGNENGANPVETATLEDSPEKIAIREREKLGVNIDVQSGCKDARVVLNTFRDAIEKRAIFVFQIKMPRDTALGFSLPDKTAPVIVLNKKDGLVERKIFTLFHEYAHVLLGKPSVCAEVGEETADDRTEVWCNRFAGEYLLPKDSLMTERISPESVDYGIIDSIARKYHLSKHMVFIRMKAGGFIPKANIAVLEEKFGKWPELKQKAMNVGGQKKSGGGPPQTVTCVSEKGRKFVSLVISNEKKGRITTADALGYLSIKLNSLDKIGSKVGR